jgi:hypothetical protein
MINLLSIRCTLAFAPYVVEGISELLNDGVVTSRVVRQGSSGLILRADADIVLRHQNRQVQFGREEARHYSATVTFRSEYYQVARMEDEVVMANVGSELLLSHPQSDLWLNRQAVAALLQAFNGGKGPTSPAGLPEWLTVSAGGGRLLISDQRNGRWVLLGEDHIGEIERRLALLQHAARDVAAVTQPPTIALKGLTVHLQSALKLAETLQALAETGQFEPFADRAPEFSLSVREATEGIEITDETVRVALTAKEALKWAEIIRGELARVNSTCMTRGKVRTVFADAEQGRWVLQWGDEVLVPYNLTTLPRVSEGESARLGSLEMKRADGFLLLLSPVAGACVALDPGEVARLSD